MCAMLWAASKSTRPFSAFSPSSSPYYAATCILALRRSVFAAQLELLDAQIGPVVAELERVGELENRLIFVTADNRASGEDGLARTFNDT